MTTRFYLPTGVAIGVPAQERPRTWSLMESLIGKGRHYVRYSSGGLDLMTIHRIDCPGSDGSNPCQCYDWIAEGQC